MKPSLFSQNPIGVFDSGVGGLTVLKALKKYLPYENFVYLGDTARLPYGTKSPETVQLYALQAARSLLQEDVKLIVVACNTATAAGLHVLQEAYPTLPIIGVVEPAAVQAAATSQTGHILVLGTQSTVESHIYEKVLKRIHPESIIKELSCPLFVSFVEEGWTQGPIIKLVVEKYLNEVLQRVNFKPDCLILGCTHFPLLTSVIQEYVGPHVTLIDSATPTALNTSELLTHLGIDRQPGGTPSTKYLVTDSPEKFAFVARRFLNEPVHLKDIKMIDPSLKHP